MATSIRTVLRRFGCTLIATGIALGSAATWLAFSYQRDANLLREQAQQVTATTSSVGRKVELLNTWVYRTGGFEKNPRYFWVSRLGPTPIDVLAAGGDCADKSRLLSAMLRQIKIESSLAMIYPCAGCGPVHTIVLARAENGWIAADPVYDITFPDGAGGYRSLDVLASNDDALTERLTLLRLQRGAGDKINSYDLATHHYRYVTTINWKKNGPLRLTGGMLKSLGYEPERFPRPQLLEDPKYALAWFFSGLSLVFLVVGTAMLVIPARTTRRTQAVPGGNPAQPHV